MYEWKGKTNANVCDYFVNEAVIHWREICEFVLRLVYEWDVPARFYGYMDVDVVCVVLCIGDTEWMISFLRIWKMC